MIAMQKLIVGHRVRYVSNKHGDGVTNPLWGGIHGYISGIIVELHPETSLPISVLWDNGLTNTYSENDLDYLQMEWDL